MASLSFHVTIMTAANKKWLNFTLGCAWYSIVSNINKWIMRFSISKNPKCTVILTWHDTHIQRQRERERERERGNFQIIQWLMESSFQYGMRPRIRYVLASYFSIMCVMYIILYVVHTHTCVWRLLFFSSSSVLYESSLWNRFSYQNVNWIS